jgi:hypothetical protein
MTEQVLLGGDDKQRNIKQKHICTEHTPAENSALKMLARQ